MSTKRSPLSAERLVASSERCEAARGAPPAITQRTCVRPPPSFAHLDAGDRVRARLIGIALQDRDVRFLAHFERAEAIALSELACGVDRHRADRIVERNGLIGADHRIVDDAAARHRGFDERELPGRRAGPVGVQREGQAGLDAGSRGVGEGGALGTEDLVAISGAVEAHMVHQEARLNVELLHAQNLVGARHRRVLDAIDAIVGGEAP